MEDDLIAKGAEVIRLLLPESFPSNGSIEDFDESFLIFKSAVKEYGSWPKSRYINSCLKFLLDTGLFSQEDQRLRLCGTAGNLSVGQAKINLLSLISES